MTADAPQPWPGIGRPMAHAELPGHLFHVAALHARRALAAATDELALLDRAGSIGTSIELLAKSALAHINPLLLAAEREPKHLLLFSGIATVAPEKAKTRTVADCMAVLNQANSIDYNYERDAIAFDVRNLASHLGFVNPANFDRALNTMVALSEQIIAIIATHDASLDRTEYWSADYLPQVDERLKKQAEARRLKLEQLKAAARHEIGRLRARGLHDDVLSEWADRPPPEYFDQWGHALEENFERRECPVCKFEGWLEYSAPERFEVEYDYSGDDPRQNPPLVWANVAYEPRVFHCPVCTLRLGDDLLFLEGMGEIRYEAVEPSLAEVEAAEAEVLDRYLDDEYEKRNR
jgi:hypothetical protein